MTETKKTNKKLILGVVALVVVIAILGVIYTVAKPKATQGAKAIKIEVTDQNGDVKSYDVHTDAEFLSNVFDEVEGLSVEGSMGDYGLYIETVNGLTADYATDGAYWAIYVNGEYGMYGADTQPVTDGDVYGLAYEK